MFRSLIATFLDNLSTLCSRVVKFGKFFGTVGECWDLCCYCCLVLVGSYGSSLKELGFVGNYRERLRLLDNVEDCLELLASVGDCW